MAIMIPSVPREFDAASQEGLMFESLAGLPDDYYVFHSFKIVTVENNQIRESETDFIIFNRELGILCLEAKAGTNIRYQNGEWLYSNGTVMSHNGPFRQASGSMYRLRDHIKASRMGNILDRCKMAYGVWFPGMPSDKLRTVTFPSDAEKSLVLPAEALQDPKPWIDAILGIKTYYNRHEIEKTELSVAESNLLIRSVFCPEFGVFPTASFAADLKKIVFHRLLREQSNILNFLEEQRTAMINGAAGTGKTMIAVEKAQRNAAQGERVLFLCFNRELKDHLEHNHAHEMIDYYTVAALACKLCNTPVPDYDRLQSKLESMFDAGQFPWRHIIVDEGQDFGLDVIEESDVLRTLYDIAELSEGTFYVFYDKLQLIQGRTMPEFLENADCRVTLYRNCRNTENIAITSLRPISERDPKLYDGAVKGVPATLHFCDTNDESLARIDKLIDQYLAQGLKDIVILTCETENSSIMSPRVRDGLYRNKYHFTTCRKFKGLEADVVILVDVNANTFAPANIMRFYVGTSRARLHLDIVTEMDDDDCTSVLRDVMKKNARIRKPRRDLAAALNSIAFANANS